MEQEAKAYNRHLTDDYLNDLPIEELRCFIPRFSHEYYDKLIRNIEHKKAKEDEIKKI